MRLRVPSVEETVVSDQSAQQAAPQPTRGRVPSDSRPGRPLRPCRSRGRRPQTAQHGRIRERHHRASGQVRSGEEGTEPQSSPGRYRTAPPTHRTGLPKTRCFVQCTHPPQNTSRKCHRCGGIGKRETQADFHCPHCGWVGNADHNAANNTRDLAWERRQGFAVESRNGPEGNQTSTPSATKTGTNKISERPRALRYTSP